MTVYEWRKLKPGDKVWVWTRYFQFPIFGVVMRRNHKKIIWLNLFGDMQGIWQPADFYRSLIHVVRYIPDRSAKDMFDDEKFRSCIDCMMGLKTPDGRMFCEKSSDYGLATCSWWKPRTGPVKNKEDK